MVSSVLCLPLSDGFTYYGCGAGVMSCWFLDCGLLVDDWASGVSILIIDEGESTVSHLFLWSCAG